LELGRGPQQPLLVPDLRLHERQDDLGARRHRAAAVQRGLERAAGGRPEESRRHPYRHLAPGPAQRDLSRVPHRRTSRQARRHVARHAGGVLRVPRRFESRPAPVRRDPGHDRGVLPAHRRSLPLGQVRPNHGGGLLRRDGERERHDAHRLAPRRSRLPRPSVVPVDPDPARACAPMVRRMLLRYLGPERFWASLHLYLDRHALGNATSDDLRQAVLDATGENLDWFWSQWVYDAGHPRFVVTAAYDTTARKLTLTVKQTQTDSAKADSTGLAFETPKVFRMPVTIRVGTVSGDVVRRVELAAREQTIEIPGLASAPTM